MVGFWETGRKDLRLSTLVRVAEALGVTLSELFTGLEAGDASAFPKARPLDRDKVLREFTVLEQQVDRVKATVLAQGAKTSPEGRRPKTRLSRTRGKSKN